MGVYVCESEINAHSLSNHIVAPENIVHIFSLTQLIHRECSQINPMTLHEQQKPNLDTIRFDQTLQIASVFRRFTQHTLTQPPSWIIASSVTWRPPTQDKSERYKRDVSKFTSECFSLQRASINFFMKIVRSSGDI